MENRDRFLALMLLVIGLIGFDTTATIKQDTAPSAAIGLLLPSDGEAIALTPGDPVRLRVDAQRRGILTLELHSMGESTRLAYRAPVTPWALDGETETRVPLPLVAPGEYTLRVAYTVSRHELTEVTRVIRIRGTGRDRPLARLRVDRTDGRAPVKVVFDASQSVHPRGGDLQYAWDFDDGHTASEPQVEHTFPHAGAYRVTLTVTDVGGRSDVVHTWIVAEEENARRTRIDQRWVTEIDIQHELGRLAMAHPDIAWRRPIGVSAQGRPIWGLRISDNVRDDEGEPRVKLDLGIHSNELITGEVGLDAARYLVERYSVDARVRAWVDALEVWIIPSLNPDGRRYVFQEHHRRRTNLRGVDLNRNFPFLWEIRSRHCGPFAGSEPETQALMGFCYAYPAVTGATVHSAAEIISPPYDSALTGEEELINGFAEELGQACRTDARQPGPYEVVPGQFYSHRIGGVSCDWVYWATGCLDYTVEVGNSWAGQAPDYDRYRNRQVLGMRPGWQLLLDRALGPGIDVRAVHAETGQPMPDAHIRIREVPRPHGEDWVTDTRGQFRHVLLPGEYRVIARRGGYASTPAEVEVSAGNGPVAIRIALTPKGDTNAQPFARAVISSAWPRVGEAVMISATPSTDENGCVTSAHWRLQNGSTLSEDPTFPHTFDSPGTRLLTLTVTDDAGATATSRIPVHVRPALPDRDRNR